MFFVVGKSRALIAKASLMEMLQLWGESYPGSQEPRNTTNTPHSKPHIRDLLGGKKNLPWAETENWTEDRLYIGFLGVVMSFPERGLVGFQVLRLGFLLCMVELSHLHLEGLGLAIIAGRVFCGQSLVLGGPRGRAWPLAGLTRRSVPTHSCLLTFSSIYACKLFTKENLTARRLTDT